MTAGHRIGAGIVALLLIGSACNSKLLRPPAIVFVDAGEHVIGVTLDEVRYRFPSAFLAYLPSRIPLHPGDALNFQLQDTGEPHTVAMGRTIDRALSSVEALGVGADLPVIEKLGFMKRVPSVFPAKLQGKTPRILRSAAEPCYLDKGAPAVSAAGGNKACREVDQPAFRGTQSFYSSGVIEEGEPFRVKLSGDIEPGTYRFMCLVHRSAMTGAVEVVPKSATRPTVAQLRKSAQDEEREVATSLETPARDAVRRERGPILAGAGPSGNARGLATAYFPRDSKAKADEVITWRLFGTHSISFSPDRDAEEGILIGKRGGTLRANPDAWKPVRGPALPPQIFSYPPPIAAFSIDGGTWNGDDTFSSGIIRATPPANVSYKLRITKPGKYKYSCLVHESMRGTIEIG
jgi:plastocyanin